MDSSSSVPRPLWAAWPGNRRKVTMKNETTSAASMLGSLGGKARAARLTPEQRTEAARRAGKARQAKAREQKWREIAEKEKGQQ